MDVAKEESNFRILMFPWLAHGHLYPYIELAKNLSKRNFNIHFCSTAINLTSIRDYLKNTSTIQLVELQLPSFPDLPPQYHTTKTAPPKLLPRLYEAFHLSKSSFYEIINSVKPDLLIYDIFQTWSAEQASSLGIPAVHFSIAGATPFAFGYHHKIHMGVRPFPYQEIYLQAHEMKASDAAMADSSSFRDKDLEGPGFDPFKLSHELVLMKSFNAIEGTYADYLSELIGKKVVSVGTLVVHNQGTLSDDSDHISEWLNKKKKLSTVFISLGSENYFSKDQIEEMAKGIELTGDDINFVWAVRFPDHAGDGKVMSVDEALPTGFLERVKDRVLILEGWAPQAKILGHPSIGAFMGHCGLSGILESLYFGVPIVAMPLKLDQPFNARLVVKAGVAVDVERDPETGSLKGEDLASAVKAAMLGKSGENLRVKAAELSSKMRNEEEQTVDEAAEQLRRICMRPK
nr:beta-D-glucosyl crocetin beta-1,6-glucosyltransferase [Bacopa monnieri]